MDGRNLPKHKPGERLKAKVVNAVGRQLGVHPGMGRGFYSSDTRATREHTRKSTIEFIAEDQAIEPHSVFGLRNKLDFSVLPLFKAVAKGWGVWTNGPNTIPENAKGVAYSLDWEEPALVKLIEGEDRPRPGDVCGVGAELTVTRKRSGLLLLCQDMSGSNLGWCVRFEAPVMLARSIETIEKRKYGRFSVVEEDAEKPYFDVHHRLYAMNVHNAGLVKDDYCYVRPMLGHGLAATKYNGGMWLGKWDTSLADGKTVVLDTSEEEIVAIAPPDGLQDQQKVNVIEYNFDEFRAYPIECADE